MARFLLALRKKLWAIIIAPLLGLIPWAVKSQLSDSFVKRFDAMAGRTDVTNGLLSILETMARYPISSCIGLVTAVVIVCAVYSAMESRRRLPMSAKRPAEIIAQAQPDTPISRSARATFQGLSVMQKYVLKRIYHNPGLNITTLTQQIMELGFTQYRGEDLIRDLTQGTNLVERDFVGTLKANPAVSEIIASLLAEDETIPAGEAVQSITKEVTAGLTFIHENELRGRDDQITNLRTELAESKQIAEVREKALKEQLAEEQTTVRGFKDGLESVSQRRLVNSMTRALLPIVNDLKTLVLTYQQNNEVFRPLSNNALPEVKQSAKWEPVDFDVLDFRIRYRQYRYIFHACGFVIQNPDPPFDISGLPPFQLDGLGAEVLEQLEAHSRALLAYAAKLDETVVKLTTSSMDHT